MAYDVEALFSASPEPGPGLAEDRTDMADYLLVYSGGKMPETDAERQQVMGAWGAWFGSLGSALKDGGNPFSGHGKTIEADGSISDEAPALTGYTIIRADSLEDAVEKTKGCPVLLGGASIHVFETFDVMAAMQAG